MMMPNCPSCGKRPYDCKCSLIDKLIKAFADIASLQRDIDLAEHQRNRGWEERDELKREAERLEKLYGLLCKTHEVTLDKCDEARAAVERLQTSLRRYGNHMPSCQTVVLHGASWWHPSLSADCSCGLEKALTDTGGEGE